MSTFLLHKYRIGSGDRDVSGCGFLRLQEYEWWHLHGDVGGHRQVSSGLNPSKAAHATKILPGFC